jgi:hypothetical protein
VQLSLAEVNGLRFDELLADGTLKFLDSIGAKLCSFLLAMLFPCKHYVCSVAGMGEGNVIVF